MQGAFLAATIVVAATAAAQLPVWHAMPELPEGWRKLDSSVTDSHVIALRLSLRKQNLAELRRIALSVSDPRSASYGQYLSASTVRSLTAPQEAEFHTVEQWLSLHGVSFSRSVGGAAIEARLTAKAASALLRTQFHHAANDATGQQTIHAADYWLPAEVDSAITAVYGMHGLPLPPRVAFQQLKGHKAANVTPAVLLETYNVSGVTASGSTKNRQAVAEFDFGETFNKGDLIKFFAQFVPSANASADAQIYKFVNDNGNSSWGGGEAMMDVEYITGVAPGVLTEFWYPDAHSLEYDDFCADIHNWTESILAADEPPLVHSVSYGLLSGTPCPDAQLHDIEANFAKLAARGITVIFASGDSGSGYTPWDCSAKNQMKDTGVEGSLSRHSPGWNPNPFPSEDASVCCASGSGFAAWTHVPWSTPAVQCPARSGIAYEGVLFDQDDGVSEEHCCNRTLGNFFFDGVVGYSYFSSTGTCLQFSQITGQKPSVNTSSSKVTPAGGHCFLYDNITAIKAAPGSTSGGRAVTDMLKKPPLYPAWPASSPWVTAVGATRFVNQEVGQPEMASDLFGSGGGFSELFDAFKDQAAAVEHYLKIATGLPPAGSFPPGGRATPDVSALGEGVWIIQNGNAYGGLAGTSVSAPTFAALVSLLNEARIQAGKPAMGYLNPFLYQNAEAFRDVTIGTNAIQGNGSPSKYGYRCAPGWDPATGLGTPNFEKLLGAAMAVVTSSDQLFV